jgi:hypothetical protein
VVRMKPNEKSQTQLPHFGFGSVGIPAEYCGC